MHGDEPERLAERYAAEDARADHEANNWREYDCLLDPADMWRRPGNWIAYSAEQKRLWQQGNAEERLEASKLSEPLFLRPARIDGLDLGEYIMFINSAIADEREACAKWLDRYDGEGKRRAEAIRNGDHRRTEPIDEEARQEVQSARLIDGELDA